MYIVGTGEFRKEEKEKFMRKIINLNEKWHFYIKDRYDEFLDIPHTWNAFDGQDGGNDYLRTIGAYEKEFETPDFDQNKERVYIQFDGVNSECDVYINDEKVMRHEGGYSTFRTDITEELKAPGEMNALRVLVDNRPNRRVYPQKADFTFYGGIYRDVELMVVNKRHFELDYFGSDGMRVTAKPVNGYRDGEITVETWTDEEAVIEVLIQDHPGNVIFRKKNTENTEGNGDNAGDFREDSAEIKTEESTGDGRSIIHTSFSFTLKDIHLWNGRKDPYLYKAVVRLISGEHVLDEVSESFGIRDFSYDSRKGFYLNGKSYPLHGVSRHQDRKDHGNAITREMHREDMDLICEMGANTIRLAHYQHSQYFYDLCDSRGMIVWAEIPYISEHMPSGRENTISQMKELIVQNYHHPSIVCWGVSNEITISTKDRKDMLENHRILNDLCHEMDKTRFTTLACYAVCGPFNRVAHITDTVSWNLYLGWYVPGLFLNDLWMRFFHFVFPKRCLGYSEYGCEGMPNLHSEKPRRGDHTEEYQALYHEYMLRCFERNPYLWATHVWNMFDFAADARNQGGEPGMNHKGLVSFDRKIKKDSFYLYKAWWSSEPFIHITSKRFMDRTGKRLKLKVYTNLKEVTVFRDGEKMGKKKGRHVFIFDLPLDTEYGKTHEYRVMSGDYSDSAVFRRVKNDNPEYRLSDLGDKGANWTEQ